MAGGREANVALELMDLAAEKSSSKRVELLRRLTETYLDHGADSSSAQTYMFNELVSSLVDRLDQTARVEASTQFATQEFVPDALAHRFATDGDINVARPMVQDYRGLSEKTLLEVARKGSQDHLQAIAGRTLVPSRVSDVVVERGDERTVRALAGNKGAQFSPDGMNRLISKAEKDVELQSCIVDRADLSLDAISKLLPMISSRLAERLQNKSLDLKDDVIEGHLSQWLDDRQQNIERTERYVAGIRSGHLSLNDVAMELVRGKRVFDFVAVMAALLELDRNQVFGQLTRGPTQSVLLLLRAIELSWPPVDGFLKLRNAKFFADQPHPAILGSVYEALLVPSAQRVVRFMKVRRAAMASP